MTKTKVLHVTSVHRVNDVRIYERECRSLVESGLYEVSILGHGLLPLDARVEHIALKAPSRSRLLRLFLSNIRVASAIRRVDFDIYHFHDPELLPTALLLSMVGRTVIWDSHEDYLSQFSPSGAKAYIPALLRPITRFGLRFLLRQVDRRVAGVICSTPTIAKSYSKSELAVVGNEARTQDLENCEPQFENKRLLVISNNPDLHLVRELIEVFKILPYGTIALAGLRKPLTYEADKEELADRLVYLGWLDRQQLASEISRSSVGAVTYRDNPSYRDASPTKAYEFAAAGLPIIASPNHMNVKILNQGAFGLTSNGYSSGDFVDPITNLFTDKELWSELSEKGRIWSRDDGSWERSESELLKFYRALSTQDH